MCPPALLAPPRTPSHFQGHARATDHRRQPPHSRTWLWDPVLGFQGRPGQEPGPPNSRVTARRQALRPRGVRAQKTLSSGPWSPLPPSCSLKSCLPRLPGQASLDPTPSTPTPQEGSPRAEVCHWGQAHVTHTQQPSGADRGPNIQITISQIIIIINQSPCVDSARLGHQMAFMTCSILHVMMGERFMEPSHSLFQHRTSLAFFPLDSLCTPQPPATPRHQTQRTVVLGVSQEAPFSFRS